MQALSVIIPVYNSEHSLKPLVERLIPVLRRLTDQFEVIFVNDDSKDGSQATLDGIAKRYPHTKVLTMLRNFGQHNALLCGIRAAKHPIIITMDDDLQHPPEEIPKLLAALTDEIDVVYGAPLKRQHGLFRNIATYLTKLALQETMGASMAANISAFRVFRTALRDAFADFRGPYVSIEVLLTWGTTRFAATKVQHEARTIGKSNYTLRKLVVHALNMVSGFSTAPLKVASILGIVFMTFGMVVLAYVLINFLVIGSVVPGFAFLACIIAIFSGVQLFALGVIGEYLGRVHQKLTDKPSYVLRRQSAENDE